MNAPFIVSKAVLPAMMEKRAGKIINICSMMSELGRETVSAYAAAKGGLKMLTRKSALNMANTTSSVMASARVTSLLRKLLLFVSRRQMEAATRSIHSSAPRLRPAVGWIRKN